MFEDPKYPEEPKDPNRYNNFIKITLNPETRQIIEDMSDDMDKPLVFRVNCDEVQAEKKFLTEEDKSRGYFSVILTRRILELCGKTKLFQYKTPIEEEIAPKLLDIGYLKETTPIEPKDLDRDEKIKVRILEEKIKNAKESKDEIIDTIGYIRFEGNELECTFRQALLINPNRDGGIFFPVSIDEKDIDFDEMDEKYEQIKKYFNVVDEKIKQIKEDMKEEQDSNNQKEKRGKLNFASIKNALNVFKRKEGR